MNSASHSSHVRVDGKRSSPCPCGPLSSVGPLPLLAPAPVGPLPMLACRSALLQPTSHIYLCFHSACRSGRHEAAKLLVSETLKATMEVATEGNLWTPSLLQEVTCNHGLGYHGEGLMEWLFNNIFYTLHNKYFCGRNDPKDGYRSPPGITGHDVLNTACKSMVQPDLLALQPRGQWTQSLPPRHGPRLALPSPPPAGKMQTAFLLGKINTVAEELDKRKPRRPC